ncbi:MAG: hypothetical protein KatS3mg081_2384 [Gemmatimonadales bacterium]|nr:MAG: hypothetical protein KatS3mg081_2384 [Gemmatimonadales bacterium]
MLRLPEARRARRLAESKSIVPRAITPEGVVDLLAVAGLKKREIWILSEESLAEARGMFQKNLAAELLRKLLEQFLWVGSSRTVEELRLALQQRLRVYKEHWLIERHR